MTIQIDFDNPLEVSLEPNYPDYIDVQIVSEELYVSKKFNERLDPQFLRQQVYLPKQFISKTD